MTRTAHCLVGYDLLRKIMPMVDGLPVSYGDDRFQVKIRSDSLPKEDYNGQVEVIVDSTVEGGFRFRPEDYGYET